MWDLKRILKCINNIIFPLSVKKEERAQDLKQRLVFINDILFHSPSNVGTWHSWIADILNPAVDAACGQRIQLFTEITDNQGQYFNRDLFFALSGIEDVPESYYLYDINKINQKSWDYLFSFINENDFLIGCELGLDLRRKFTENNIVFINFWFHSFHLFDDICFMLNTNNKTLFHRIKEYQIPHAKFELYAHIAKRQLNRMFNDDSIEDNCCLFIGQTLTDKSVERNGEFLNIMHFPSEIDLAAQKYKTIYYLPHPDCPVNQNVELMNFISQRPYIQILDNVSTYGLLASPKVKAVIGISSSVLYEAQFFGKENRYLYQPLFDIDTDFGENTYISVYNDYLNPEFWIHVLPGFFGIKEYHYKRNIFDPRQSCLRGDVLNFYHGYRVLDKNVMVSEQLAALRQSINNIKS